MKYLKPYNESNQIDKLYKTCQEVFAELIDNGDYLGQDDEGGAHFSATKEGKEFNTFDEYYNSEKEWNDKVEDINIAIKRLKDEFPNANIEFRLDSDDHESTMELEITLEEVLNRGFYVFVPSRNSIRFNFTELRKMLGLPKKTEIGTSSSGTDTFMNINFENENQLEEYSDGLIDRFEKIKIEGELLNQPGSYGYSSATGDIIKKNEIKKNYKQKYYSGRDDHRTKIINQITFSLSKKFDYNW